MTMRRLAILQWVGLLAGAGVWVADHLTGLGVDYVGCSPGGTGLRIDHDVWEGALMATAALLVLGAEAAALTVLRRTNGIDYEGDPPPGRIRFFAIAAVVANVLFLTIILLDGFANLFDVACRQG